MRTTDPLISVIVAAHNEEACLPELFERLRRSVDAIGVRAEIIFVDDGSTDASFTVIERLARIDPRVRGVRLSRNEGHQAALMCGMDCADGDVAITLDADLQHPPEHIPAMIASWREGFDVVHMTRRSASGSGRVREILTSVFYRLFNLVSEVKVTPRTTDFRLMDRRCVDALASMRERLRFLRGMVRRIGFRQTELPFDCPARFAGTTSYTLPRLCRLAVDALVSFSSFPVALPLILGGITLVAAASALAALVVATPPVSATVAWALALTSAILFGLSFLLLGLLGAYLSRLLVEVKGRPLYFIDRVAGQPRELRAAGARSSAPDAERPRPRADVIEVEPGSADNPSSQARRRPARSPTDLSN